MTVMQEIQEELQAIVKTQSFQPVEVPERYREMGTVDAARLRVIELVTANGGYESLAQELPHHNAKYWKRTIESDKPWKLGSEDFSLIVEHFDDDILPAILGVKFGMQLYRLKGIPESDHSLNDLVWALRRLFAEVTIEMCQIRDASIEGARSVDAEKNLCFKLTEMIVLTRQICLAFKAQSV